MLQTNDGWESTKSCIISTHSSSAIMNTLIGIWVFQTFLFQNIFHFTARMFFMSIYACRNTRYFSYHLASGQLTGERSLIEIYNAGLMEWIKEIYCNYCGVMTFKDTLIASAHPYFTQNQTLKWSASDPHFVFIKLSKFILRKNPCCMNTVCRKI